MGASGESFSWDFFIAHAGADESTAVRLYELLEPKARVFLDKLCVKLGDDWDTTLAAAQKASLVTVVLVSTRTERAYYQREEIAAAIAMTRSDAEKHRVVPIYVDADALARGQIPYGLRLKHGLQIGEKQGWPDAATALLALLDRLRHDAAGDGAPAGGSTSAKGDDGILLQPPADWESPVRRNRLRYKVAAFDLDGTLLRGPGFEFSWEVVWKGLGFGKGIQSEFKREYRAKSEADPSRSARVAAYRAWCEKTCEQFRTRGLTRDQIRGFSQPLTLTRNCREALTELRKQGLAIAIISGGIHTFLEDRFPDFRDYVDFVFINELLFAGSGRLEGVRSSSYDFQGKVDALDFVNQRVGCTFAETVFVGDHFNDEHVMLKAAKAIAYPPQDTVTEDVSHKEIAEDDLLAVVPHILVE